MAKSMGVFAPAIPLHAPPTTDTTIDFRVDGHDRTLLNCVLNLELEEGDAFRVIPKCFNHRNVCLRQNSR